MKLCSLFLVFNICLLLSLLVSGGFISTSLGRHHRSDGYHHKYARFAERFGVKAFDNSLPVGGNVW